MPLYILPTNHIDVDGPAALRDIYDKIKPNILLSEIDKKTAEEIKAMRKKFRKALSNYTSDETLINRLDRVFSPGFECDLNEEYSQRNGVQHHMIGAPSRMIVILMKLGMHRLLNELKKTKTPDLSTLILYIEKTLFETGEAVHQDMVKHFDQENGLRSELRIIRLRALGLVGKPDKIMERGMREIYDPEKVIAFPVGASHALDSRTGLTLYSRIKDLDPIRLLPHTKKHII